MHEPRVSRASVDAPRPGPFPILLFSLSLLTRVTRVGCRRRQLRNILSRFRSSIFRFLVGLLAGSSAPIGVDLSQTLDTRMVNIIILHTLSHRVLIYITDYKIYTKITWYIW